MRILGKRDEGTGVISGEKLDLEFPDRKAVLFLRRVLLCYVWLY